jgi:2-polyprenyl-6-methoxyphenol hydroxylase-like FAD-dependent oxidoreductase
MKIAIVGGGPSGLYLAILLKRRRPALAVTVIEQNQPDSTFGFGVVLADSGLNRIEQADPEVYRQLIAAMTFNQRQTIRVKETPIELCHPAKGGAIARIDLLHILQKQALHLGVDLRFGTRIEHPDQLHAQGVGDADVVVGADGINSVVRAAYAKEFGSTRSLLTNRFAWFGTRRVFERSALVFRQWQGGSFVAHYYPYCATGSTFVAECDESTWNGLGLEGMEAVERQRLIETVFAPELAGEPLISNNSNWRQFPVLRNERFSAGRHVLIGDAHTSAHFSIGSGTRIAMEDSIALADSLTQPGDATPLVRLARFEATRGPVKQKLLAASRKSYLWYEQFGEWMRRYTPHEFVYAFMTRTGRVGDERLARDYPQLVEEFRRHGVGHGTHAPVDGSHVA